MNNNGPMSLKQKTLKGLFWSFLDSFGIYFIKFGFSIVIARTLSPSDYGLMGMIVIFTAIGDMLVESGFSMALIQKKDASDIDYSTVFWFNLSIAVIIYLVLFFSANLIADFFNEPILTKISRVTGLNIILTSLRIVQLTVLSKKLNFKKQTYINFASAAISGIIGVVMAIKGYAVWALVFQTLAGSFISTIGFWMFNKWLPKLLFSFKSLKSMFRYGSNILLQGATSVIFEKLYFPFIGKYFNSASLGFYTFANRFYRIFIRNTAIAYGRVSFPAFTLIQNDLKRFNRNYFKVYRLLAFVMFPLSLFLIVTAKPFILVFLTEKWLSAVPLMQLFFTEGFFFALFLLNLNTFNAKGRSDISFKVDMFKKALMFISLFATYRFGIKALIIGQVVSSFISFILSSIVIQKTDGIKIFNEIKGLLLIAGFTLILLTFDVLVIDRFIVANVYLLIFKTILLPFIYLLLCYLFKIDVLYEFLSLIENLVPVRIKGIFANKSTH